MTNLFRLRTDSNFAVKITMLVDSAASPDLADRFADWVERWVRNNEEWTFVGMQLRYSTDFLRAPTKIELSNGRLSYQLDGKAGSRMWRAWNLRLMNEARAAFPEILKFDSLADVPAGD